MIGEAHQVYRIQSSLVSFFVMFAFSELRIEANQRNDSGICSVCFGGSQGAVWAGVRVKERRCNGWV